MKRLSDKISQYILVIAGLLLLSVHLKAQGPYDYNTPLGKNIYNFSLYPTNTHTVYAQEWGSAATGFNGLTLVTMMTIDQNKKTEIFNFYNSNSENYLKIFSGQGTLTFRRMKPKGSVGNFEYFDYILYDRMFNLKYGTSSTWEIRLYFTSDFFWIQTTPVVSGSNEKSFLSPVYFGLNNMLQKNNMYDFINAAEGRTKIIVGNEQVVNGVKQVAVYAFQYDELQKHIQDNFCNPFNISIEEGDFEY